MLRSQQIYEGVFYLTVATAKMTFLCLIEIRFCFNGFAATFVFGGLLIIRLVGEAHTSLLLLLVGYNQLTNEPALLMLLRDGA